MAQVMHKATVSRSPDRLLFLLAAVGIGIVVVLGFGPTYFYRPFATPKDSLTVLVHVHGALMSAWIALFITQVILVAVGRTELHRRLGKLGFVLLWLIVLVLLPMTIVAAKLGGDHMPGPPLPGLALVLGLLFGFLTFAGLGLHYRFRSDIHKRLMTLAALAAMEAASAACRWISSAASSMSTSRTMCCYCSWSASIRCDTVGCTRPFSGARFSWYPCRRFLPGSQVLPPGNTSPASILGAFS